MRLYRLPAATGIDDLTAAEAPSPTPGPGQITVRVRAVSLNYRDLMIATGRYGGAPRPGLVPCSDAAGEVLAVGDGVTRVRAGDRVCGTFHQQWLGGPINETVPPSALGGDLDGVLAEEIVLGEHGVVKAPERLSFEQAATLPCAAVTAWDALFNGQRPVKAGDTVLTLGTGGVSVFAIQFAKAAGARVVATSSSDDKLDRAKALGADDAINYRRTPEWGKEVTRLTGGVGADVVVEIGGGGTMPQSLAAVRRGGTVAVIGVITGGEIDPRRLIGRAVTLRGVYVGSRDTFEAMNRAIAVNAITPVIDRVFEFGQAKEAYRHLESGAHVGKVVIRL